MQSSPSAESEPQLSVTPLQLEGRKSQDVKITVIYGIAFLGSLVVFSISFSPAMEQITHCKNDYGGTHHILFQYAPFYFASLVFSLLAGVAWMQLLRYFAKRVLYTMLFVQVTVLLGLGVFLLHLPEGNGIFLGCILCGLGLLNLLYLWLPSAWSNVNLTVALIQQSFAVVSEHPTIVLASAFIYALMAMGILFCSMTLYFFQWSIFHVRTHQMPFSMGGFLLSCLISAGVPKLFSYFC